MRVTVICGIVRRYHMYYLYYYTHVSFLIGTYSFIGENNENADWLQACSLIGSSGPIKAIILLGLAYQ